MQRAAWPTSITKTTDTMRATPSNTHCVRILNVLLNSGPANNSGQGENMSTDIQKWIYPNPFLFFIYNNIIPYLKISDIIRIWKEQVPCEII